MKRKIFSVFFALVLVLTLGLVTAAPAGAATINVTPGANAIQNAIDAAQPGDIINVAAGDYSENINVTERVILQADSGGVTVIPASGSDHIFYVTANNVTIDGFTLVGDTLDSPSRGILLEGVTDCTISNNNWSRTNPTGDTKAIELLSAHSNIIQGNTFTFNEKGTGIRLNMSDSNLVKNNTCTGATYGVAIIGSSYNTIQGNTTSGYYIMGAGISLSGGYTDNLIKGNTCSNSGRGIEIKASRVDRPITNATVIGNTLTGNANAITLDSSAGGLLSGITITENTCQASTSTAIWIKNIPAGSSITISNNDISGNLRGFRIGAGDASFVRLGPDNNIVNNPEYGVNNEGTGTLDATINWWGTTDADAIAAMVEGTVDYTGYLTAPGSVGLNAEPDLLPTVATSAATDVDFTSATLNGDLSTMGTAEWADVWFEYGTDASYGQTTPFETKTGTGLFSASLSGLTQNTDYHFRAVARSADGTSYGDDVSLLTLELLSVTTMAATDVDLYSATLNANLDDLSSTSVIVSFEYGTTSSTYSVETAPEAMNNIGAFSAVLTDLTHNTTYYFRAKAVGDTTTVYGAELSFTTVVEIIAISVSPTSIDFGSILAGESSDIKTVTVTNEGNIVETFTATLIDEVPEPFYTDNLKIDSMAVTAWSAPNIVVDGAATPGLVLAMPDVVTAGSKTATIVFWVEETP